MQTITTATLSIIILTASLLPIYSHAFGLRNDLITPAITDNPLEVIYWVKDEVTPENEGRVLSDIQEGLQLWEDVSTSNIRFVTADIIHSTEMPVKEDHQIMIVVGNSGDLGSGGASFPSGGNPGSWYGAVADMLSLNTTNIAAHEIGHALGFLHSTLIPDRDETVFTLTEGPIMHWRVVETDFLHQDDVAAISTAYPHPAFPLSAVTGTITGRLIDGIGIPLNGINVVAVNTDPGNSVVSGLSGTAGCQTDLGEFILTGIPAGNYQIEFRDGFSYRGSNVGCGEEYQADNFTYFSEGPLTLSVGDFFDLGDVTVSVLPISLNQVHIGPLGPYDDITLVPLENPLPIDKGIPYEAHLLVEGGLRNVSLDQVNGLPSGMILSLIDDPAVPNKKVRGRELLYLRGTAVDEGLHEVNVQLTDKAGIEQTLNLYLHNLPGPTSVDLLIEKCDYSSPKPKEGRPMSFKARIKNRGVEAAFPTTTRLTIDGGTTYADDEPTSALAGERGKENENWRKAWTATAGTHTYEICVDANEEVFELNEFNNCTGYKFVVASGESVQGRDLFIEWFRFFPSKPKAGKELTFKARVKNQGAFDITTSEEIKTVLKIDGKLLSDGNSEQVTMPLEANKKFPHRWARIWPTTAGPHTFEICVDTTNVVAEADEANNCVGGTVVFP